MRHPIVCAFLVLGCVASSRAGTYYYSGSLTSASPVFKAPGASAAGVGQFYSVLPFTVGTSGAYSFETASPNTASSPSNALDTYLVLYAGAFNPETPGAYTVLNDDFTGTFSVLPGPFSNVSTQSTASVGAQPGSRIPTATLTAGLSYFLVNTSYRETTYNNVDTMGLRPGGPTGAFFTGISGVGSVNPVPEPTTLLVLGLPALALLRPRKRA